MYVIVFMQNKTKQTHFPKSSYYILLQGQPSRSQGHSAKSQYESSHICDYEYNEMAFIS